jgi:2-polyprenyl-3-methyl-5-hydroxy-6-metoxy-1,4-benzoquinol methylase
MLKSWLGAYIPALVTEETWNREYASGVWDYLSSDQEFARYAVIIGYLMRISSPHVLDVGCGHGRLLELTSKLPIGSYQGLDVSSEAIERAKSLAVPHASFVVSGAESFVSSQRYDAIVFNEIVHYLSRPTDVLARYHGYLNEGGSLIVSMWDCRPARWLWWQIGRKFSTLEATRLTNQQGLTWDVRKLQLKAKKKS